MYTKGHIEKILRINGLSPTATDEEIKSVLLYARCEDTESIIAALRNENVDENKDLCGVQRPSTRCNVLLADERLKPETIKELLGIDVEINFSDLDAARARRQSVSTIQLGIIFACSAVCAAIAMFGIMWYYQIGFFHPFA
ncbi:MAG: hypothetical protein WDZ93_03655 [Candidatus Paceibacterota bacterium]